jgi:hypothetical protein
MKRKRSRSDPTSYYPVIRYTNGHDTIRDTTVLTSMVPALPVVCLAQIYAPELIPPQLKLFQTIMKVPPLKMSSHHPTAASAPPANAAPNGTAAANDSKTGAAAGATATASTAAAAGAAAPPAAATTAAFSAAAAVSAPTQSFGPSLYAACPVAFLVFCVRNGDTYAYLLRCLRESGLAFAELTFDDVPQRFVYNRSALKVFRITAPNVFNAITPAAGPAKGTVPAADVKACASPAPSVATSSTAADAKVAAEVSAITAVMTAQVACWNAGSVDGYMSGYWRSADLRFVSTAPNGVSTTTRGWDQALAKYKKAYDTPDKRGKLSFSGLTVALSAADATEAEVTGRWRIDRSPAAMEGKFVLTFRKFDGKWLITVDRTS